jgi:hypothetical protein
VNEIKKMKRKELRRNAENQGRYGRLACMWDMSLNAGGCK